MADTVGFGILGAGVAARYHKQAIEGNHEQGARLVGVAHYDPTRFEDVSAEFGVPCMGQDDLLARPDVDVVCICTPSGQHAEQTIAAARAGKHVLVEKPMALTLADADAMIEACARAGVLLGVALQRRAEAQFQRVREAIAAGSLGELTLGVVTLPYRRTGDYYAQAAWRGTWEMDGGGVLMNQGIHLVDLLIWTMGDPVAVQAYSATLHHAIQVEDTLAATLRFPNGALATITATTTTAPGFPHRLELYGTGGGIQIEGETIRRWETVREGAVPPPEAQQAVNAGAGSDPTGIQPAGHILLVRDFLQALREGRPAPVDGAEGRRSLAAVLAIYEAAAAGGGAGKR
jgi:UDP-N-acetyl-2-amino-2-deoxyglucuronate dehydrogenase